MDNYTESEIAQNVDTAGVDAKYDAAARKLVSQKAILAYILKSALDEFADVPVNQIAEQCIEGTPQVSEAAVHQDHPDRMMSGSDRIEGLPTEDSSIREGTVRYDIRFIAKVPKNEERIEIIVNIEIQSDDMPGYPIPQRGIYYGSRLISAQRGTIFKNQEYDKIKKVVSIWICESTAQERSNAINEYSFVEKCKLGTYQEARENYDLMTVVVMRLGPLGEQSQDDAIRLLSKVFSTERSADDKKSVLAEEFKIEVTETLNQEVANVCNLSTGIYTKGVMETLFSLVQDQVLTVRAAAKRAGVEESLFEQQYKTYLEPKLSPETAKPKGDKRV